MAWVIELSRHLNGDGHPSQEAYKRIILASSAVQALPAALRPPLPETSGVYHDVVKICKFVAEMGEQKAYEQLSGEGFGI